MLKVKVNNNKEHKIVFENPTSGTINGSPFALDMIEVKQGSFHIIKDLKSFNVEVVEVDFAQKSFLVNVNGNNYQLNVENKFDELLKTLGFDNLNANKINEIKAPMPGLVIDVCISEGDCIGSDENGKHYQIAHRWNYQKNKCEERCGCGEKSSTD